MSDPFLNAKRINTGCPTCNYGEASAVSMGPGPKQRPPRPGDPSICMKCGEILEFDANLKLQVITIKTLMEIPDDISGLLQATQRFVRVMKPCG
jgi:hypothetical protein